jgi:Zn-dependent M28 family amino/carboxypeptidase
MRRWTVLAAAVALLTAAPGPAMRVFASPDPLDTSALRDHVRVDAILKHLRALERIADANGGNRASGTSGYDDSVDYVVPWLVDKGYQVTLQEFDFPFFQELAPGELERVSPSPQTFAEGTDFDVMTYSGSGEVTAPVQPVDTTATPTDSSTSGCEPSDFSGFVSGRIALVQRGTCTFRVKASNAEAAGAGAVVVFNRGTTGSTGVIAGTLGSPGIGIPVLGTTFAVGQALYSADSSVVARVFTSTISEVRTTSNIIADTLGGRADKVVLVGGHLDSVPEGPGIVDNGSGVATMIEIARRLNSSVNIHKTGAGGLRNKVRFAFWAGEEFGLLGARHYVGSLTPEERSAITLNLNFDMIASSNGVRFVMDGDGSTFGVAGPGRSAEVEQVFLDYFESQGLATVPRPLDGRSDWLAFTERGIGAGSLSTGSDQVKTEEQAEIFGGTPGVIMHPCYHTPCDRVDSVHRTFLDQMADAAAHATLWVAMDGEEP